jgi:hypothetical protein
MVSGAGADSVAARATGCPVVETVLIGPAKYNELYAKFGNLNRLLGWGHARVHFFYSSGPPPWLLLLPIFVPSFQRQG